MEMMAALAAAVVAGAGTCSMQSPAHRVALVELYTSEGCESCPPADKFMKGLQASDRFVPLALHVDYWNYLGWKDVYSRAAFTERQRWLSDLARSRTVYTPEFFVGGQELRNWHSGGLPGAIERINAMPAGADLALAIGAPGAAAPSAAGAQGAAGSAASVSRVLPIDVRATARQAGRLHVALTENGISSQVMSGENKGRLLQHDHVVREWLPPVAVPAGGTVRVAQTLPLPQGANPDKLALVAFVQTEKGEILQAASLQACKR